MFIIVSPMFCFLQLRVPRQEVEPRRTAIYAAAHDPEDRAVRKRCRLATEKPAQDEAALGRAALADARRRVSCASTRGAIHTDTIAQP